MTTDYIELAYAALAAIVASLIFYGGLWLTVRHTQPAIALFASFTIRLLIVLLLLFFSADQQALAMSVFLLVFMAMRLPLVKILSARVMS